MTITHDFDENLSNLKLATKDYGKLEVTKVGKKSRYVLLLYNNDFLKNDKLIRLAKENNILLQPDLFSEV